VIVAAIPVRNNLKWTAPLVEGLLLGDEVDEVWVYDNGSTDDTALWLYHRAKTAMGRLKYIPAHDMRFYEMWNHMILKAAALHDVKLAILNNDIRLPHMALKTMADNMGNYDIVTIDTTRSSFQPIEDVRVQKIGGWWHRVGWAFMVRADFWKHTKFPIDPRFNLWYGDDYLYRTTLERGGRVGTMIGVGCDHAVSQTEYPEDKQKATEADKELFDSLWP
jgi:glycosyltransferase involved in cell wall biosynthesis